MEQLKTPFKIDHPLGKNGIYSSRSANRNRLLQLISPQFLFNWTVWGEARPLAVCQTWTTWLSGIYQLASTDILCQSECSTRAHNTAKIERKLRNVIVHVIRRGNSITRTRQDSKVPLRSALFIAIVNNFLLSPSPNEIANGFLSGETNLVSCHR